MEKMSRQILYCLIVTVLLATPVSLIVTINGSPDVTSAFTYGTKNNEKNKISLYDVEGDVRNVSIVQVANPYEGHANYIYSRAILSNLSCNSTDLRDNISVIALGGFDGKYFHIYSGLSPQSKVTSDLPLLENGTRIKVKIKVADTPFKNKGINYEILQGEADAPINSVNAASIPTSPYWPGYGFQARYYWTVMPQIYYINTNNCPISDVNQFITAVQAGFMTWNNDPGSYFNFNYGGTTNKGEDPWDNQRTVCWGGSPNNQWIGLTHWCINPDGVTIADADIILNLLYSWTVTGAAMDVQDVVTHEVGHVAGLLDITDGLWDDSKVVMNGYYNGPEYRTLKWGDKAGIRFLYPNTNTADSGIGTYEMGSDVDVGDLDGDTNKDLFIAWIDNPDGTSTNYIYFKPWFDVNPDSGIPVHSITKRAATSISITQECGGLGVALGYIDSDNIIDAIFVWIEFQSTTDTPYYTIGWDYNPSNNNFASWGSKVAIPTDGIGWTNYGCDIDMVNIGGSSLPDVVFCWYDGALEMRYKVGWDLSTSGAFSSWGSWNTMAGHCGSGAKTTANEDCGIAVGDFDNNGINDFVFCYAWTTLGGQEIRFNVGWNVNSQGVPTGWEDFVHAPYRSSVGGIDGLGLAAYQLDSYATAELVFVWIGGSSNKNLYYEYDWEGRLSNSRTSSSPSDTTIPTCVITSPLEYLSYTTGASITLSGTASDNIGVSSVTWYNSATGVTGTATGTTSWTATSIALNAGENIISMMSHDASGNTATDSINVIRDNTAPTCTITTPSNNPTYSTTSSSVNIGGTASDNIGVTSITWTNAATGGSGTASGTTSWILSGISLNVGGNSITVSAKDASLNTGTDIITITRVADTVPPICTITIPTNNPTYSTASSTINLGGTASDGVGVTTVSWTNAATGGLGPASGTTSWTISGITLNLGDNSITVGAKDASLNTGTDTITITRVADTIPPICTITSPTIDPTYYTTSSTINLVGTTTDLGGVTSVKWTSSTTPGGPWPASGTTSWTISSISLNVGSNLITVNAYDASGNIGSDTITVIRDNTPPSYNDPAILINGRATRTTSRVVTLTLSASDANPMQMRFSNDQLTWSTWEDYVTSKTWTLLPGNGDKTVSFQVRDLAGNTPTPLTKVATIKLKQIWIGMATNNKIVNFNEITTPYGSGYHVDSTTSTSQSGFDFMGYCTYDFKVQQGGTLTIRGFFMQNDGFGSAGLSSGRTQLNIYILDHTSLSIITSAIMLTDHDPVGTWIEAQKTITTGLPQGTIVKIGVGRPDLWDKEWNLVAEWSCVRAIDPDYYGTTVPPGYDYNFKTPTDAQPWYTIDTVGISGQYGFDMMGYSEQYFVVQGGNGAPGTITISGNFLQFDTFDPDLLEGRRWVILYALDPIDMHIISQASILDYQDDVNTWYSIDEFTLTGLNDYIGDYIRIGIGRPDSWDIDWSVTASWSWNSVEQNIQSPSPIAPSPSVTGTTINGWYVSKVEIALDVILSGPLPTSSEQSTSTKSPSNGVIYYRIDDGNWEIYKNPIKNLKDGIHEIDYYSVDENGVGSNLNKLVLMIDTSGPTRPGVPTWTPGDETDGAFSLSWAPSSDPLSGLQSYTLQQQKDDGKWITIASCIEGTTFSIGSDTPLTPGIYHYRVCAVDSAGNVGHWANAELIIP